MDIQNEIYQRLSEIDNQIARACQASGIAQALPSELRECLGRLEERSRRAVSTYLVTDREAAIADDLGEMEILTQRACSLCEGAKGVERLLGAGLSEARQEIRDLRRQLTT